MFVISVMPTYLGALADHKGLTGREIAWVGAADSAGALISLVVLASVLQRLERRWALFAGLMLMALCNLGNLFLGSYAATLVLRGLHGMASTILFGLAVAYFSNTAEPERWFAWRATVAVGLQSILFVLSPWMIGRFGVESLYLASLLFTPLTFWAILSLPQRPQPYRLEIAAAREAPGRWRIGVEMVLARTCLLVATALFSFYYQPLFTFSERLGRTVGMDEQTVGSTLAVTTLIGVLGSLAVSVQGNRFGRSWPLWGSGLVAIATAAMLSGTHNVGTYWLGLSLFSIVWSYFPCYQFSLVALADASGSLAVAAQAVAAGTAMAASGLTGELLDRFGLAIPGWVAFWGMVATLAVTMLGDWLLARAERYQQNMDSI
jgi:predicted MFS family arabinose efflux permease